MSTNIPTDSEFTNTGTNSNTAWGVATSGILIYNGLSGEIVDPFYPAVYGQCTDGNCYERVDACLAHPQNTGEFHYHMQGTCAADSTYDETKAAASGAGIGWASKDILDDAREAWKVKPYRSAFGISKDGRPIYGPYHGNMQSYADCDVDVCNGLYINGHYSYVSTWFHPYIMGCYGPGNNPSYSQQCSSNPRNCNSLTDTTTTTDNTDTNTDTGPGGDNTNTPTNTTEEVFFDSITITIGANAVKTTVAMASLASLAFGLTI